MKDFFATVGIFAMGVIMYFVLTSRVTGSVNPDLPQQLTAKIANLNCLPNIDNNRFKFQVQNVSAIPIGFWLEAEIIDILGNSHKREKQILDRQLLPNEWTEIDVEIPGVIVMGSCQVRLKNETGYITVVQ